MNNENRFAPIHKEGDIVKFENKIYKAGKYEADVNLRYLHDVFTGYIVDDSKGFALKVNETRLKKA